jgi:dinuclear metal center YbgI/SA1388 family protein
MESIAPTALAQDWDNVGLLAGDLSAAVKRVLLCIDLTDPVVDEAIREKVDLILAYHPPIFKPIRSLRMPSTDTDAVVFRCIRHGIAIYSTHTALDAADGGTNDVIASLCGIKETEPLEYVDEPRLEARADLKVVVFVPAEHLEKVANAMFAAGAGHIGDYSRCSYRLVGKGTFFGGETTDPTIGERGRMEQVDEIRLESVVPTKALPAVVGAIYRVHPYDEPAFDIYPLRAKPTRGIGRRGKLPRPSTLSTLARKLKRQITSRRLSRRAGTRSSARGEHTGTVHIIGPPDRTVTRAIIVVGAAGSLPFRATCGTDCPAGQSEDVIITGEIRHHDALTIKRLNCTAIALGHWASEHPTLAPLAQRIETALPGITTHVSDADSDPFRSI